MRDEDIIGKTKRCPSDFFETNLDGEFPSRFYIKDAIGEYLFFLVRDRSKAVAMMQHLYGKKYTLRETHQTQQKKQFTAVGTATRKGQKKY